MKAIITLAVMLIGANSYGMDISPLSNYVKLELFDKGINYKKHRKKTRKTRKKRVRKCKKAYIGN